MKLHLLTTDANAALPPGVGLPEGGLGLDPVLAVMAGADRHWLALAGTEAVGVACLWQRPGWPEIGYGVAPERRGRGIAQAIVGALQDHARATGLGGLTARTAAANPASGAVLVATGFGQSGHSDEPGRGRVLLWSWPADG